MSFGFGLPLVKRDYRQVRLPTVGQWCYTQRLGCAHSVSILSVSFHGGNGIRDEGSKGLLHRTLEQL